eukprot:TRINITY_DN2610_c0_g1_i2.p1 TRINITY_DN2610_c0_g1~~TRINITY_DN2610_c0_g1_i2.p1  ORF type:complete len:401 (-),score=102.98 TRINITY_DN2610_c0_g1_i2:99-1301(-)
MSQKEREEAVNEIRILASLTHPNIIGYKHAFVESNKLHIVTEYARCGDLYQRMKKLKQRKQLFPEDTVWSFFIQITLGLRAMHNSNMLHRDIKAANIFLNSNTHIKIGDLGVAKFLKNSNFAETSIGTPYYLSPEIWTNRPYNAKSDIWSLGCLLYEMMTLRHPFEADDMKGLSKKVVKGRYAPLNTGNHFSKELIGLVDVLLKVNPDERPTCDEILSLTSISCRLHLLPNEVNELNNDISMEPVPTIRVPKKTHLKQLKLPAANFDGSEKNALKLPSLKIASSDFDFETSGINNKPNKKNNKKDSDIFKNLVINDNKENIANIADNRQKNRNLLGGRHYSNVSPISSPVRISKVKSNEYLVNHARNVVRNLPKGNQPYIPQSNRPTYHQQFSRYAHARY